MSAKDCLAAKAKAGKISRREANRLTDLIDRLARDQRGAPEVNAGAEKVAVEALRIARFEAAQARRRATRQIKAQLSIRARAQALPGKVDKAMLSFMDFDPSGEVSGPNVSITAKAIRGQAQASMVDFIDKSRSKALGISELTAPKRASAKIAARFQDVARELYGEATGDAESKALADGIRESLEFLRLRFNAAGGAIPKRKDWGLPQLHNRRLVAAAKRDDWVEFTFARLDREKMIDLDTGVAMTEGKLRRVLGDTYDTIVSDGMNEIKPGGFNHSSIIKRRQESRFLMFRDAGAWSDYQARFGDSNIRDVIAAHIEGLSREIALIEVLGPNPEASLRFMESLIDQAKGVEAIKGTGDTAAKAAGRVGAPKTALRNTFAVVSGQSSNPANPGIAAISAANRNVLVSAMLGGAFLSSLSDRTFASITARFNGIPAAGVLKRHMKLFLPGSTADKKLAIRLGFGAEGWASQAIGAQRYLGEFIGPEWSKRLADTVLRGSLLSPWTQAGRWGFMTEFLGHVTDQAGKTWNTLEDPLRQSFIRHGLGAGDWEIIRATTLWRDAETGAEFIRPQDIAGLLDAAPGDGGLFAKRREVATALQSMILTENEFAVPSTTARVQALLLAGNVPGSFMGEVLRNVALFKSFPVTLLHTHLQRAVSLQGGIAKAKYIAHLVIGTAIMGALGQQLRQISIGRDPMTMDPATSSGRKFWIQALGRGGGLGIFGDFLFSDVNRFGGGIANTLLGPALGTELPAAARLTLGNIQELVKEGSAKNAGRDLTRFIKLMAPGRSLWYTQLAMERLIFDEMQKMIDPGAAANFRRIEQRVRRDRGQRFFSAPGSGFPPRRAPDLGAVLGP